MGWVNIYLYLVYLNFRLELEWCICFSFSQPCSCLQTRQQNWGELGPWVPTFCQHVTPPPLNWPDVSSCTQGYMVKSGSLPTLTQLSSSCLAGNMDSLGFLSLSLLSSSLDSIQCLHRADQCNFFADWSTLMCPCVEIHWKMLLISWSILYLLWPACFAHLTWMVCEMDSKCKFVLFCQVLLPGFVQCSILE